MNYLDLYSREKNPETGAWFAFERSAMETAHNGTADIDALLATEYGALMTESLTLRLATSGPDGFEKSAMELAKYGVRAEFHDDGDFFSRWGILLPEDVANDSKVKYPLIIINGGGPEETVFSFGFYKLCKEERFLCLCCRNHNWEHISWLLEEVTPVYPIDRERVYICGFSYMGYQATSAFTHLPYKFAGAAPCGNDIFRDKDNFLNPYTEDELKSLRHHLVPFMQIVGASEASNFVPLNDWHIRAHWGNPKRPEDYPKMWRDPRDIQALDPTINPIRRRPDGTIQSTPPSAMPAPPEGMDRHIWMLSRLNTRLDLLRCQPRDMEKCISYLNTPEDELHHVLGFYGDTEEIREIHGLKHYIVNIYNRDGLNAFRQHFCRPGSGCGVPAGGCRDRDCHRSEPNRLLRRGGLLPLQVP
ncbi:MAG: hypothetical protein LIO78_02355 [Clostridiales bacterium]|nr:hypothetical protein [Clostridiales bacterium]